jgi:hypothetical protein
MTFLFIIVQVSEKLSSSGAAHSCPCPQQHSRQQPDTANTATTAAAAAAAVAAAINDRYNSCATDSSSMQPHPQQQQQQQQQQQFLQQVTHWDGRCITTAGSHCTGTVFSGYFQLFLHTFLCFSLLEVVLVELLYCVMLLQHLLRAFVAFSCT